MNYAGISPPFVRTLAEVEEGVGIDSTSPFPPFTSHCVARAYTHMHTHTHGFNQRKSCGEENDNNPTFYDCARALVSVAADRERGNKDMCSAVTQGKEMGKPLGSVSPPISPRFLALRSYMCATTVRRQKLH